MCVCVSYFRVSLFFSCLREWKEAKAKKKQGIIGESISAFFTPLCLSLFLSPLSFSLVLGPLITHYFLVCFAVTGKNQACDSSVKTTTSSSSAGSSFRLMRGAILAEQKASRRVSGRIKVKERERDASLQHSLIKVPCIRFHVFPCNPLTLYIETHWTQGCSEGRVRI